MAPTKILLATLIMLLAIPSGCSEPPPSPAEMKKLNGKINQTTMSIAVALKSMWNTEQAFTQGNYTPRKVDLETWWISLTSTRLNMKRALATINDNPSIVDRARNLWAGRIQENLNQIIDAGLLTTMQGPITSRLEATYGAERVQKEMRDVLALSQKIEERLDLPEAPVPN